MEELLAGRFTMEYAGAQFRLSTDSMVLADFAAFPRGAAIADLGCGCGALSLLLCAGDAQARLTGVELQPDAAACARRNAGRNGLTERFTVINGDLREHRTLLPHGAFDGVISNPPYYPAGSGRAAGNEALALARSELACTLDDLCRCAAWLLKYGGRFCLVHKPERLADLICTLRENALEPKRIRFVRHRAAAEVNLVLLEARRGARPALTFLPDLILYHDDGSPSADFRRIYHQEV